MPKIFQIPVRTNFNGSFAKINLNYTERKCGQSSTSYRCYRGLGKEVSLQLLQKGCIVILAARTFDKAHKSCQELLDVVNILLNQFLIPLELDISSQGGVKGCRGQKNTISFYSH